MTRALLCDADGCLFPSEEPAFEASTIVVNRLLGELGVPRRFTPDELQAHAVGRNFRSVAEELAATHGAALGDDDLERWVAEERDVVVAHLSEVLRPDPAVIAPLERLAGRCSLAVVSSSALARLSACFTATGLDALLPAAVRFSAEDSLPVPTSKPDPAIYAFACEQLGVAPSDALAVEDSVTGARSAVGAGVPTIGNLTFVPEAERPLRQRALRSAGADAVVRSWGELEALLPAVSARASS